MLKSGLNAVNHFLSVKKRPHLMLAAALALSCLLSPSVQAEEEGEWSVTLIKHANKAIGAYNRGDYVTAKTEFRTCIGLNPKNVEFYEGLMNSCVNTKEWDQVAFAANEIAKMDPSRKGEVAYFNGIAMYQLNRMDEAVPWLKQALAFNDKNLQTFRPQLKEEALAALSHPSAPAPPPIRQTTEEIPNAVKVKETLNTKEYLGYETAIRAETIVTATYEGYDKGNYSWGDPPIARFHIIKNLKGSPLNKDVPIRFEFHDALDKGAPAGWKWDPAVVMPKKGSEWILFIEFAYVKNGAYETYQGSYGRQPATEENMNKVYALLDQYNMRNPNTR